MNEEEKLEEIDKIAQRYFRNMQLEMKRFANDILELKFAYGKDEN